MVQLRKSPSGAAVAVEPAIILDPYSVLANPFGVEGAGIDFPLGANTVLGRQSGDLVAAQIISAQIAANNIVNSLLAQMPANSLKANPTALTANADDFVVGTNTVVGRASGNLVAAQVVNAQITGGALGTVKGVAFNGSVGVLTDMTGQQLGQIIRFQNVGSSTSGSIAQFPLTQNTTMLTFNGVTNVLDGVLAPTGSLGQLLIVQHIGAGTTTIPHESTSAPTAADRFRMGNYASNASVVVLGGTAPAQTAAFLYDGTRWVWMTQALGLASIIPSALAPVSSNIGVGFKIFNAFGAGAGGAPDDVILMNANASPGFRILDVLLDVATAVGGSSCQLRNATGGGGGAVSSVLSSAATGSVRNNVTATNTIALGGTLVLRRSDSGVAGSIIVDCVPI